MTEPRVTIIITFYNFEPYVTDCLASILRQKTQHAYKIICIDDCSTDNTWGYLRAFQQKFPDKIGIYKTKTNQGWGRAAMFHIRPKVTSDYVIYLDGDDFWHSEDKLERQINFLDEHPDFVGSTHSCYIHDTVSDRSKIKPNPPPSIWCVSDSIQNEKEYHCHISTYIWRNKFIQADGFCLPDVMILPQLTGDVSMSYLYLGENEHVRFFHNIFSVYRMTGKGIWTGTEEKKQKHWLLADLVTKNLLTSRAFENLYKLKAEQKRKNYEEQFREIAPEPNFGMDIKDLAMGKERLIYPEGSIKY